MAEQKITPPPMSDHERVFGVGVKFDAEGKPVEVGIGSKFQKKRKNLSLLSAPRRPRPSKWTCSIPDLRKEYLEFLSWRRQRDQTTPHSEDREGF
jgi:hypothetical protein